MEFLFLLDEFLPIIDSAIVKLNVKPQGVSGA